jgi:hypothetical protein
MAGLGIGAAGAGGLSAATINAGLSGAIGSGLNTGIQGGDLGDVLKSAVTGGLTAGAGSAINTALIPQLNNALPSLSAPIPNGEYGSYFEPFSVGARNIAGNALEAIGVPESAATITAGYLPNVVTGAARGALKGDVLGGVSDAVLGQVVNDISPTLKLSPAQGRALAGYLRTGDEVALAVSLGSNLAKQAINSAGAYASGATPLPTVASTEPTFEYAQYEDPQLSFLNTGVTPDATPDATPDDRQINITGTSPTEPVSDTDAYINSMLSNAPAPTLQELLTSTSTTAPTPQQVVVTPPAPAPAATPVVDEDAYVAPVPGYDNTPPPVSSGQTPQTVTVTGATPKPVPDEDLVLPPYDYSIPELAPLEPPKVEVAPPLAPPLAPPAPAPAPAALKELDINAILSILGGGAQQQEPVMSQVLAQMRGFDVEKEFSPTLAAQRKAERASEMPPQERELAALLEELNRG